MVSIVVVEGGGDTRATQAELRKSFGELIRKLGVKQLPAVTCAGGRGEAYRDFKVHHAKGKHALLLVDSEACVQVGTTPWAHVRQREGDKWEQPGGTTDEHLHFMAPTTEAWLAADPEAMGVFYGQGFNATKLPQRTDLEEEAKLDLNNKIAAATRGTSKGVHQKSHTFHLVGTIDPLKVRARCRTYAERFFAALESQ